MKKLVLLLANEKASIALGYRLANLCQKPIILYLYGDLGVGKTTFSRGFLQGLGYQGYVKSPTYTLVESYSLVPNPVYHFDLYRLTELEELEFIGIREYFDGQAICLVEWPKKGEGILPCADLELYLSYGNHGRQAQLVVLSTYGETLLKNYCNENTRHDWYYND
ncbi:MAG: tRNA (adenosine(37)-N6)-threonylcarbamoyltransferase complex ATPase subunit type 1 TsaE [Candidatus Arsenophonus melophagi]|nr:tRNA (adenosine(37)-N6)-threonylcarbamoyltransferase complex ATPase subunit type 1 TsaE [Candidatus Arsenophonus melophagi]